MKRAEIILSQIKHSTLAGKFLNWRWNLGSGRSCAKIFVIMRISHRLTCNVITIPIIKALNHISQILCIIKRLLNAENEIFLTKSTSFLASLLHPSFVAFSLSGLGFTIVIFTIGFYFEIKTSKWLLVLKLSNKCHL